MQVSVTNTSGAIVPLTIIDANGRNAPYGLAVGATASLLMPDSVLQDLVGLRASGRIMYTLTVLPMIPADTLLGAPGRTEVVGTAYTLQNSDRGCIIDCISNSPVTLTLPAGLVRLWSCSVMQYGTGAVTFVAATGATLRLPGTATKTNGQYTVASVFVRDNQGGASAEWVVAGNVA